jgi:hypothetical protein
METITDDERKKRLADYMRKYRANNPDYVIKYRFKKDTHERELIRMKNRYARVREWNNFRKVMPLFLTE